MEVQSAAAEVVSWQLEAQAERESCHLLPYLVSPYSHFVVAHGLVLLCSDWSPTGAHDGYK